MEDLADKEVVLHLDLPFLEEVTLEAL